MPSYGSLHSPSLRKMEHSRTQYGRQGIRMANIVGDPFALATVSISAVSGAPLPSPRMFPRPSSGAVV